MKKLAILGAFFALLLAAVPVFAKPGKGAKVCHLPDDYTTIQDAIEDTECVKIIVGSGEWDGALVDRPVEITSEGNAIINNGPAHSSGLIQGFRLLAGSDGTIISHLQFEVDFPVMNGEGVDNVTISHNSMINSIQGVSNWVGSNWSINHNDIRDLRTRCGGGIGILVGSFTGNSANDNVISHNDISGTLFVDPNDCGGYNGTGIVLYADYRWGRNGGPLTGNRVVNNKVSLVSDTPDLVNVVAIELTDTRDDENIHDIVGNAIGFNDLRGTTEQIALTPSNLDESNDISRNLGDNRGHGLHPSLFGPGGM